MIVRNRKNQLSSLYFSQLHTALISVIRANPNYLHEKGLTVATGSFDRLIKIFLLKHSQGSLHKKNI